MAPIPIYTDAPITPIKAEGVTPRTAYNPTPVSAATTTATSQSPYPAAQPGAAAAPTPTSTFPPPPTHTRSQSITAQNGPPPPQPGAVPTAPSQTQHSRKSSLIPPPPQAGQMPYQPSPSPITTTMPPQMSMAPPQTNAAPTHSTYPSYIPATHSPTRANGPTTINLGPVSPVAAPPSQTSQYAMFPQPGLQSVDLPTHPPGYKQDPYAAELSAAQRASLEAAEAADKYSSKGRGNSLVSGILGDGGSAGGFGGTGERRGSAVWDAVVGFATAAGQKAVELEEVAWKAVGR